MKKLLLAAGIAAVAIAAAALIYAVVSRKPSLNIAKEVRGFFEGLVG